MSRVASSAPRWASVPGRSCSSTSTGPLVHSPDCWPRVRTAGPGRDIIP
jgi:hypothetical protein